MLVSLCGTPGTGKTSTARELRRRGYEILSERDLIRELGCFERYDSDADEYIADPDELRSSFLCLQGKEGDVVLDGHLSYLAPAGLVIVLRAPPWVVGQRLEKRGYPHDKVRENVIAEAVGYTLIRSMEEEKAQGGSDWKMLLEGDGKLVVERDVGSLTVEESADWVERMIEGRRDKKIEVISPFRPGSVDWLEAHSRWY